MATAVSTSPGFADEAWTSVKSRVSWGALIAGAAVGIAIYSVLAMLGVAVGLTVVERADAGDVGVGAAIWAFVSLLIAMFFAGWVATLCTVGESRTEAVLYGVIVWAITSSLLLWSAAAGISLGATAAQHDQVLQREAEAASALGQSTAGAGAAQPGAAQMDRTTRERLATASWWTFGGTVLSILAAIGGALIGPYDIVSRRDNLRRDNASTRTVHVVE